VVETQMKRMVVPDALRVTRLKPLRRYCVLGRISAESGWQYKELVERLEDTRKTQALEYYAKKKEAAKAQAEAEAEVPKPAVMVDSGY
jgi:large subunit ribosomal protein L13Ae